MIHTPILIRAKQLLTMPEAPDSLTEYHPDADISSRDADLLGLIDDGAVILDGDTIAWVGPYSNISSYGDVSHYDQIHTRLLMPGIVDCHTHAVFSGDRSKEFELRNAGRPYVEILEAGGGILNTVDSVRRASTKDLTQGLIQRTYDSVRRGVTTLEVKSGYGLTTTDERKMLRAVQLASPEVLCELVPCFLGAHAFPREYRDNQEGYVNLICEEMIPLITEQKLTSYCDVFCDRGAFSYEQAKRILSVGKEHGLIPRVHADELTNAQAAKLAIEIGASSADHLELTPPELYPELAANHVTPVLMPAVNLFLGTIGEAANARGMIAAGCDVAVASDFNPGSAMTQDMQLMTTLACTIHKLTPGEALRAITIGGAKALNRTDIGRIAPGLTANLALFNVPDYRTIPYHFGENHIEAVFYRGECVHWTELEEITES